LTSTIKDNLEEGEYEGVFDELLEEFQGDALIKKKIQDYSKKYTPSKFDKCLEIVQNDILGKKEKVIIWTIFIQNAKQLQEYFSKQGIVSELLIGEIAPLIREDTIEKFNNPANKDFSVVIANPFSVAESISLHEGCHNAIYLERDYNCSNFLQSKDRIHRV